MDQIEYDTTSTCSGRQNIMEVRKYLEKLEQERCEIKEVEIDENDEGSEQSGSGEKEQNVESKEQKNVEKKREKIYLVAVGVEIDSTGLSEILDKELPETKGKRPEKILSGVYYSPSCSKQHTMQQTYARKEPKEMMEWFQKKVRQCETDNRAFIKTLHIAKNGRIIAGEVYTGTDKFFVFFYNERGVPTTLIKKELCQGYTSHYAANYRTIHLERMELTYRPYYHHQKDKNNVIEYE